MMSDLIEGVGEEIIWAGLITLSIVIITMAWISTGMPPIEYYVWLVQMQIYPNRHVVQVLHMDHEDAGVLENQLIQRTATMQQNITGNITTSQAVTNITNINSGSISGQSQASGQNQSSNAITSNIDQRFEPSAWSIGQSSSTSTATLPATHRWEIELGTTSLLSSSTSTTNNSSDRLQQTLRLVEQTAGSANGDSDVNNDNNQSRRLLLSRVRVPLQQEQSATPSPEQENAAYEYDPYDSTAINNDRTPSLSSGILRSSASRTEVVERLQDRATAEGGQESRQQQQSNENNDGGETDVGKRQKTSVNMGGIQVSEAPAGTSTSAALPNSSTNLSNDNTRSEENCTRSDEVGSVFEKTSSGSEGLSNVSNNDNNDNDNENRKRTTSDGNSCIESTKLNNINNNKDNGADEGDDNSSSIIKLKFLDDSQVFANTTLDATVGQFKRRYFLEPLVAGKVVRLIYRGQLLRDDSRSLQSYGLHDQCVLHCHISSTPYAQPNNTNNSNNQMNIGVIPRSAFEESSLQSATAAAIAAIAGTQSVNAPLMGVGAELRRFQSQDQTETQRGQTYRGESIEDNPNHSVVLRTRNTAIRAFRWIHNAVLGARDGDSLNADNNNNVNDAVEQAAEAAARGWTAGQREDQPIIGGRLGQSLQLLFIVKFVMLWAFVFFYPQYTDRFSMLMLTFLTLFFATIVFSSRYNDSPLSVNS